MRQSFWRFLAVIIIIALFVGMGIVSQTGRVWAGNTDTPLYEYQTYGQCSDDSPVKVAVSGVGMYGQSSGTISLSLPATATVEKAYLYWTGRDPYDQGSPSIRFEGATFQVGDANTTKIGGPAFWGTNDFAWAYRADVTPHVSPSKTSYTFTDPYFGDPDQFDISYGAALVVIYRDSADTWPNVVSFWEGMDIAEGSSSPTGSEGISPVTFTFDPAAVGRTANLTAVVGGVATGSNATLYYLVGSGTPPSGDIYSQPGVQSVTIPPAQDGNVMTTLDLSVSVPAGKTYLIVQVKSEDTNGSQLHWIAQTFEMDAACPRVQVEKTLASPASGPAHVGDTVTYDIAVTNSGNTTLTTVPITDTYDTNYLIYAGLANPPTDNNADDGTLNWSDITASLGDIGPGETKHVTVSFTAKAGTQSLPGDVTTNTATVSGAQDQNGHIAPPDSDTEDVEISNPSIAIVKERALPVPPDQYATVGETVRFTITVTNTGDTILNTVPLTDTYSTMYLTFSGANPSPDDSANDGQLNWSNIGPLNPGDSTTVVVEFTTAQSSWNNSEHAKVHNYAEVSALDENGDVVDPEEDTAFVRITRPDVSITKTLVGSDTFVPIGGQVTYRIVVENTGDTVLTSVPVVDTFPTHLSYVSDTSGITPTQAGNTLTWADVTGPGSLNPGDTFEFDVVFNVTQSSNPSAITNTACVQGAEDVNGDDPGDVCDDDSTVTTTRPAVSISKVRTSSSPILVGDVVTFTIYITNTGDTTLATIPVSDTYNTTYLTFSSANPSPVDSANDGQLDWSNVGPLAPGASTSIVVTFTGSASTTGIGGATENSACVAATDEHNAPVGQTCDSAPVSVLTPAAIGNYVWLDANGNGVQDAGELGVSNVTVKLYDADTNTVISTTQTNSSGYYEFTHLFPGNYYLEFVKPSGYAFTAQDQGGNDAKDSDANTATGKTASTTLTEGETDDTWDAGLYQPVTIGDYVWEDMNGDGIQNDGSTGISGVTVKLYYAGPDGTFGTVDDAIYTTTTDGSGLYEFTNKAPGTYKVEFVTPSGYAITLQDEGVDDAADSDANPATGMTPPFSITSGQTDRTYDVGMYRPVSIGDFVWEDSDADQVQDPGEGGLDGFVIELRDGANNLIAQATTSGGGHYLFDNLRPGTYKVIAPDTHGSYVHTTPTTWGPFSLQSGDARDDADFGYIAPTAVQIVSFHAEVTEAGVHLVWRTMLEENVDGFRVERALAGTNNWRAVTYVPAQGAGATYSAYDGTVRPGLTYAYRLITSPSEQAIGPWSVSVPKMWEPGAGIQSGHRLFVPIVSR